MNYSVKSIVVFERQAKRLIKKYPSLKQEILNLIKSLTDNPTRGVYIGNGCYKIRLAIASKQKGKSGGARVITHIIIQEKTVYLFSIYDKSEKENLSNGEILELLQYI